jgi:hypothetical protein
MSVIHWLNPISGSFTNASDWSGGKAPGAADDAVLDAVGTEPYTVTSTVNELVHRVQTNSDAQLSLTGGTFTASAGTGTGANAGIILIGAGATFVVGGSVANTGSISLNGEGSGGGSATLLLDATTTLSGGGEFLLAGDGDDLIGSGTVGKGNSNHVILYNSNILVGSGTIGDKKLTVINDAGGTIEATGSTALNLAGNVINQGLLEAGLNSKLILSGNSDGNAADGVLLASNGSVVKVNAQAFSGGTLESSGSGRILISYTRIGGSMINDATVLVGRYCAIGATFTNNGDISIGDGTLETLGATLTGTGAIIMSNAMIRAPDNFNPIPLVLSSGTIEGGGHIGVFGTGNLAVTIGASGLIDSDARRALYIGTNTNVISNAGTMESTGSGGLTVYSPIANSGLLTAEAGIFCVGATDATESIVNTGTISVSADGTLIAFGAVTGKGVARIDGGTLDFASAFNEAVKFAIFDQLRWWIFK